MQSERYSRGSIECLPFGTGIEIRMCILGESVVGATSVAYLSGTKDRSCCQQHPMHETMMVDLCI